MWRARYELMAVLLSVGLVGAACGEILDVDLAGVTDLPQLEDGDLKQQAKPQTSRIFDKDGRLVTTFHGAVDRTIVDLEDLPPRVRRAVIAMEDERFYDHDGIDLRGIARAAVRNLQEGEVVEGGSTITQQYVKNRIIEEREGEVSESMERKIDEAALARQLESELSKNEILERYLNSVYFGNGAYGIQAAAQTYFRRDAADLSLRQAALLAGLIRAPATYDPFEDREVGRERRDLVLDRMQEVGFIPPSRAQNVKERGLGLADRRRDDRHPAPYFVDYVKRMLVFHPRFDFLGETPEERTEELFTGGLHIHTTLDRSVQRAAEQSIDEILHEDGDPSAAMVAIDPRNGRIRAMVGGEDFFEEQDHEDEGFAKLNLAITGRPNLGDAGGEARAPGTGRQAGSAFKPFALAAALDGGIPLTEQLDAPPCKEFEGADANGDWRVCNFARSDHGQISLHEALVSSVNVAFAELILDVGPNNVTEMARKMGLRIDLSAVPSAVLGTNPVSPLGMSSAFATFATNGRFQRPMAIKKVEDPDGEILHRQKPQGRRVMRPAVAYTSTRVMQDVVERGTGTAAQIGRPAAGKTGTAQQFRDAWFAGFTPQLSAAVWVGYPEASIEMRTNCPTSDRMECRPTRINVTGGSWPAQIWQRFMTRAMEDKPARNFQEPSEGLVEIEIDTRTGCPARSGTPDEFREEETFVEGAEPRPRDRRCRRDRERDGSDSTENDAEGEDGDDDGDKDGSGGNSGGGSDPQPTQEPDPEPTDDPDPEPTDTPEPEPTDTPEPEPTDTPEPEPSPT